MGVLEQYHRQLPTHLDTATSLLCFIKHIRVWFLRFFDGMKE